LTITGVQTNDAGSYSLIVTNTAGSVTSTSAVLTIIVPPAITTQPLSATNVMGTTAGFSVAASGTAPVYQWQMNGVNLANAGRVSGALSPALTISNVQTNDAGNYSVIVSNAAGNLTSTSAVLTVTLPPTILTQPLSVTNVMATTASFGVTASGTAPLIYQWRLNGVNLTNVGRVSGVTSPTLTLSSLQAGDAGNYSVIVSNTAGSVASSNAALTVVTPPVITAQPLSATNLAGTTASFGVTASSSVPPTYQWRLNGVNLTNAGRVSGVTSATLTIINVQTTDVGNYSVIVSNTAGATTSTNAALSVNTTAATYVTAKTLGTLRDNFSGYVGMKIVVGATPLMVTSLGRITVGGNNGTHTVKLVNASDGTDVPGGAASVAMSGGTAGQFQYTILGTPVTLTAGSTYYVVSQETAGGDYWYDLDTTVTTAPVAAHSGAIYGYGPGEWYPVSGTASQTYVPVDFTYTTNAPPPLTTYVVSTSLGTARNNFSGYVGMKIVVGISPLTVTSLGRITANGNNGTHILKLVNVSDGSDVLNGTVPISMSGGTPGQFQYAALGTPASLAAGTAYYLMSQEVLGGDYWYDMDTTITTTAAATHSGAIYGFGPGQWYPASGTPSQTYVPVDFTYATNAPPPPAAYITSTSLGTLRNNFSGYVGMKIVVGATQITVTSLGRMMAGGNSGTHIVKLVNVSDGSDVTGGAVSLSMGGGTPGEFHYAPLNTPLALPAGTAYYLMSQETAGGDFWYDNNTTITTTTVAAPEGAIWGIGQGQWNVSSGSPNQTYVPVDFQCTSP
jgi:hypothetical protein